MIKLDDQQRKAVQTVSRKTLVLSGAGSGKTRVLTERINYLIQEMRVSPYEIIAFSFTRKASNEIKTRLEKRIAGGAIYQMLLGTMHSIALGLLRRFGEVIGLKPHNITVYSAWEEQYLLRDVAISMGIYNKKKWKIPKKQVDQCFHDYYENGIEPEWDDECYPLFRAFMMRCKENNSLTYGGLLTGMKLLIPTLAKHLHIKHILVDEVQDINPQQWGIINAMVEHFGASLFVVGDIDQSLYKFRGAVPEYLIERQDDFDIFRIETNYRSDAHIVNMANRLINYNKNRIEKTMVPFEDAQTPVTITKNTDSDGIVKLVETLDHVTPGVNRAILCRIHAPLQKISNIMKERGIKHTYIGSKSALTNSEEFRRFHAFLKLIVNPFDNFAFLLIRDLVGLSSQDYSKIRVAAAEQGKSHFQAWLYADDKRDIGTWAQEIESWFQKSLSFVVGQILHGMGVMAGVDATIAFISEWIGDNETGTIEDYLSWLATYDIQDEMKEGQDGIQLMTIHAAKGLEWATVIIAGCNEGILPSGQAIKAEIEVEGAIDDERRLAYVAWTRAEDQLILTVRPEKTTNDYGKTFFNPISRFIGESQ